MSFFKRVICEQFHQQWWCTETKRLDDETVMLTELCRKCQRRWGVRKIKVHKKT